MLMWYPFYGKRSFPNKPTNSREENDMIPQRESNEAIHGQTSPNYGGYEGEREYALQHVETPYEQMLREEPEGKVYPPQSGSISMFYQFVIVFVISMIALFAFAVLCLVWVGGTGGWIGFIAASFAILCIASTFIGMNTVKRDGGNMPQP
jgi:hypothetical protein